METPIPSPPARMRHAGDPVEKRLLRIPEFRQVTGLGRTWVYDRIKDGRLRTVKAGGARLIPVEEAERIAAEGCR
jgi:predicted DNA-binding transcriptional regulator AlpA